ncbi:FadR/GntR family transcriptional regulator [Vreelandella profundi]|uniref:FadR/GntR family transcriptional regulator n=1 Tax=Vreelandella profundi TaxID=2852117 RepID=UPI001EEFCFE3|nr:MULTISPECIES: FadR/GntR family transcriptional regulator [Halomonas]MDN7131174.1 FadR/GntR family transcriptional regulator [Halomonas sp. MC140]
MAKQNATASALKPLQVNKVMQQGSLSVHVADQLEALITQGKVTVGEKLPTENSLCDSFGVSRTVIREAITHLKSLGLVATRRGVGTTVLRSSSLEARPAERINPTTVEDILHLLELRLTLEPAAAELAALRHDDEDRQRLETQHLAFSNAFAQKSQAREEDYLFHFAIATATKNPFFQSFYKQWSQSVIPRAKLLSTDINPISSELYLERVQEEHSSIIEAILSRDAQAARETMFQHLNRARNMYAKYRDQ